jgi:hypothetical protein
MAKMTKKGARQVTDDLDKIANLFQNEWEALGVPQHIASDFALRCDMVSDAVERTAGVSREAEASNGGWDAEQIGEEVSGPEVQEPDEPYMRQEFSQQENRELRERQQAGDLGPTKTTLEPQTPTPGVQASFKSLVTALKDGEYSEERVARALRLATDVVKQGKGKVPPEFLENIKKKKDDGDDEKKDEKKDDKKASAEHGYNLFA